VSFKPTLASSNQDWRACNIARVDATSWGLARNQSANLNETPHLSCFSLRTLETMPPKKVAATTSTKSKSSRKSNPIVSFIHSDDVAETEFGFPQAWVIDFMKGITPVVVLLMTVYHNRWASPTQWVYFGTHGTYGMLWVLKSRLGFGDAKWQGRKNMLTLIQTFFGLMLYWLPIYLISTNRTEAPAWVLGVSVMSFGLGVFWHFAADMHKTVFLEYRKVLKSHDVPFEQLLTTKMWALSRNPNYFGELLIYNSFCILAMSVYPYAWLAMMVGGYWLTGMVLKDESLSRFGDEWNAYKKGSSFFIPYIW
jgi:protein-S-isoprenylcysteine O-methyltransferase Ste14